MSLIKQLWIAIITVMAVAMIAATALITDGPFARSRNPIYTGNTMLLTGVGLLTGIAWFILAALIAAFATQKLAIEREERHLATRFGKAWDDYAARTPRWLGRP
mgnify:CR=1 FL=1